MIGDDACTTFVELLKKMMDIIGSIEKDRQQKNAVKSVKMPKIKVGKLSKKDFEKLQRSGREFKYITIPAEKHKELEETVKKMGGSFFDAQLGDDKNHVIAVPASQLDLLNMALKHVVAKDLVDNPSVDLKDGNDLISEEDMPLVRNMLNKYDIPVISFKTEDNKYMNIVPKEYEGQYAEAMKEVGEIKAQIDNIDVVRYDQTAPLDDLDKLADTVKIEEAEELANYGLDIELVKIDSENAAILYKPEIAEDVQRAREEYAQSLKDSEDYVIDVMDNVITLDIEKLMIPELCDDKSFFMRVPNTKGQDYISLNRDEVEIINNGKTVRTELDFSKTYPVYDAEGAAKREVSGMELAKYFNTKNLRANAKTQIFKYGTDGKELRRIDLYSQKKNELISTKLDTADNIRIALKEHHLSPRAIEKLLADINEKLTEKQKEIFKYSAEKSEVVYADVPNIGEYLAQTQLSRNVITAAECKTEIPKGTGAKCCVHDKNNNTYAIFPVSSVGFVKAQLASLGYAENAARELAEKIARAYRPGDNIPHEPEQLENAELKNISENNAELNNVGYYRSGDKAIIVKEDSEDYHYMQVEKDTPFADIEKALREDFGIVDDISAAIAVKQLQSEGIIPEPKVKETKEAEIGQITTNIIEVKNKESGDSVLVNITAIDTEKLTALGLTEKAANDIKKSFGRSIEEAAHPEKQTLGGLVKYAEIAGEKLKEAGKVALEKVKTIPNIGKGDER